jgi:hypothetical protein
MQDIKEAKRNAAKDSIVIPIDMLEKGRHQPSEQLKNMDNVKIAEQVNAHTEDPTSPKARVS